MAVEKLIRAVGQVVSWLTLLMVVLTVAIVIARYGFDRGSVAVQELVLYAHAAVFMLGAAYALGEDRHVRVDVFYRGFSPVAQAWVNLLGVLLLLLPLMVYLVWVSWPYVVQSWAIGESSREAGGLPFVYLLKTLLLAMPVLVALQGMVMAWRAVGIIRAR